MDEPDHVILELPVVRRNGASTDNIAFRVVNDLTGIRDQGMLGDDIVNLVVIVKAEVINIGELSVLLSWDIEHGVAVNEGTNPLLAADEVDTTLNEGALFGRVAFWNNSFIRNVT